MTNKIHNVFLIMAIIVIFGTFVYFELRKRNMKDVYYHIEVYANDYDTIVKVYKPMRETISFSLNGLPYQEHIIDTTFNSLFTAEEYSLKKNLRIDSIQLNKDSKEYIKIN